MSSVRLNLVVAACNNNGIGKNGELPWRLKKDMAFFKKITSDTKLAGKQNAVIMGRKTWFSIPEKFRPLKGRVNVVLSRELNEVPEGVHIARSLPDAVNLVTSKTLDVEIENVHIIGGSSVYKEAMTGRYDCRLFLTRIFKDFDCDTFLPTIDNTFQRIDNPEEVPSEIQTENDVNFQFEVYDKHTTETDTNNLGTEASTDKPSTKHAPDSVAKQGNYGNSLESGRGKLSNSFPFKFNIMAAMCHGNRGIGDGQKLPWPSLREDADMYLKLTSTPEHPDLMTENKKIVHINGKNTFMAAGTKERSLPHVYYVTISKTLKQSGFKHPRILQLVETFDEAVDFCDDLWSRELLDSVWIMGGQSVYKEALNHPRCGKLHLTHVYTDFTSTAFFPAFEKRFVEISDDETDSTLKKDNDVEFQFKVYRVKEK